MRVKVTTLLRVLCPAEVVLLVLCTSSGVTALSRAGTASPNAPVLPPAVALAWGVALLLGSVVALAGLVCVNWLVVRIGYTLLGPSALAYGLLLVPLVKTSADGVTVVLHLLFSAACLWRVLQITREVRALP